MLGLHGSRHPQRGRVEPRSGADGVALLSSLPPHHARKLLRHRLPMLRPFACHEGRPVGGASEAFAIGRAELELHRESAFAERRVFFEGEAFLELHLSFGCVGNVADFDRAAARPGEGEGC